MLQPEVTSYLQKAKERLLAAKLLHKEKLYDDSASRAYYAALFAAKAALLQKGLTAKSHDGTIKLFGSHVIKRNLVPKSLGVILSRLRTMREKAEYSPANSADEEDAAWSINAAELLVATVEKMLTQ
jgi:uncharacterized protein (UPF0332 family)